MLGLNGHKERYAVRIVDIKMSDAGGLRKMMYTIIIILLLVHELYDFIFEIFYLISSTPYPYNNETRLLSKLYHSFS